MDTIDSYARFIGKVTKYEYLLDCAHLLGLGFRRISHSTSGPLSDQITGYLHTARTYVHFTNKGRYYFHTNAFTIIVV